MRVPETLAAPRGLQLCHRGSNNESVRASLNVIRFCCAVCSRVQAAHEAFGRGGGAEGNRTPDLLIANEALSQLSYSPGPKTARIMVTAPPEVKATFRAGKCRSASNLPARAGLCEGAAASFRRAP